MSGERQDSETHTGFFTRAGLLRRLNLLHRAILYLASLGLHSTFSLPLLMDIWEGNVHNPPEGLDYGMLPAANAVSAKHAHGEEAEGEVEHRQPQIYTQCYPAILTRQFAHAL